MRMCFLSAGTTKLGGNEMKKLLSLVLCLSLIMAIIPVAASGRTEGSEKGINTGNLVIDSDPTDGYTGDYVVIYNPSSISQISKPYTGNMNGLIETEIGTKGGAFSSVSLDPNCPYKIDVDSKLAESALRDEGEFVAVDDEPADGPLSFEVGDTHVFRLYAAYCPLGSNYNVEFKVLAVGEHCYVWTPTSEDANVHPLDKIDESFAQTCANEFDSKFDLMQESFGEHSNGTLGDGKINLLYYNINDGWQLGSGYVAGFFTYLDLTRNGMPCLNIDTYPGVHYTDANGDEVVDVTKTYNTMVHEYQHLINYSILGNSRSDPWYNECMSAAAEELCYPGSSVAPRIQAWMNYSFSTNGDWDNPPAEHEYNPNWTLHNGFSMYDWSETLPMDDTLAQYAQVSLYAQYIYTRFGNTTFRSICENMARGNSFVHSFRNITKMDATEFTRDFRIALVANQDSSSSIYGFKMQEGYNPANYHGVENLYSWLAPVVFTGDYCSIDGGGAIVVKPVDGVYYPPAGASSKLRYYGITLNYETPDPVELTDISLPTEALTVYKGGTVRINALREPENANGYNRLVWESSNPEIATVAGDTRLATVTGVESGSATITVSAYSIDGENLLASASVEISVLDTPTLDEALNIEGGELHFSCEGSRYEWRVDLTTDGGDIASAKSSNANVYKSSCFFTLTVNLNRGDKLSFDWRVSSELNHDMLKFYVGDSLIQSISGETKWDTVTYEVQEDGEFTFKWSYDTDSNSYNIGSDSGWVDNVYVIPYDGTQETPTPEPTPTVTPEVTPTAEPTPTETPEIIPTPTEEPTPTATPEITPTVEPTVEPTPTPTPEPPTPTPEPTPTPAPDHDGDVNGDGEITTVDALLVLRAALGISELSNEQASRADVNGDGNITTVDALIILRMTLD